MVRGYGPGGGGPGFNLHHIKLSGLEVRPFKVSGGSPVHLGANTGQPGQEIEGTDSLSHSQPPQNKKINDVSKLL